ncbi:MAG: matrixin family metalloprotease, partial [Gemmatirosa sp.]
MTLVLTLFAAARLLGPAGPSIVASPSPGDSARARACDSVSVLPGASPAAARGVLASMRLHGATTRWAVPRDGAIRLWVEPRVDRAGSSARTPAEWMAAVGQAVREWQRVPSAPRFVLVADQGEADVRVVWAPVLAASAEDVFATGLASFAAGRTELTSGPNGIIRGAVVTLARATPAGVSYSRRDVTAVAVHELGHVLGLAHRSDAESVMSPLVTVDAVTALDAATVQALYALPAGMRCHDGAIA